MPALNNQFRRNDGRSDNPYDNEAVKRRDNPNSCAVEQSLRQSAGTFCASLVFET